MDRIDDKNIGKLLMVIIFLAGIFFIPANAAFGQYRSYKLSDRGDTLNCIDMNGLKQGPWLERFPELRGNPGYEEEGEYVDGKKEGVWRKYTLQGDIMAVESYRWG
ncbi:MAG TPA: hypothetical protein VK907_07335, partial [Phnomibacter sp.]|nr:hypothetical protein [Phnomibacter sp.]